MTLWQIDIYPSEGTVDREGARVAEEIAELRLATNLSVAVSHSFLIEGDLDREAIVAITDGFLKDPVTQRSIVAQVGSRDLLDPPTQNETLVHVMAKPGVMDPVAQSTQAAVRDGGWQVDGVRTVRKYWLPDLPAEQLDHICKRALSNDSIEQVIVGPLQLDRLQIGSAYEFELKHVSIGELDDAGLEQLSKSGQLYLTLVEMQTIQKHFQQLGRDPTDIELESIAQTWSEHCSHKTLAGRIAYRDEKGERHFENMLKETIFAATQTIRKALGEADWCVSVFEDNAGVVTFDDEYNICFKVETHNHPSALEPYGGANTGIGGVIRDPLGTGMGAKPICNTDVFCFASPNTAPEDLPAGVLHPRRVMKGVVSGVRDYGNRMGIPTVNGAVYFDKRYLGNPLVYAGNVGLLPVDKCFKEALPGDYIVAMGGRTGRDGIHGATFSSAELTSESESLSGGAVQIGNAITEKMVADVLLQARDEELYNAVTDCGAGGFSSAVGEMGEKIGAEVWLEKCPLKYDGLSYTEIWISEAQERMVLSVSPEKWDRLRELCENEGVEVTRIGVFQATGKLRLMYADNLVGEVTMEFLHDGRPPIVREAVYQPPQTAPLEGTASADHDETLRNILGSLNVASKEWIIRQYDHEVQGGSVIKPLVGVQADGPGDAAVVRPRVESRRGIVISCGMNPHYGDFDTYHMAAAAIDEAMRNAVAVGADPGKIAILDNFCWGYTDRPETLGSLVRAAIACQEMAVALGTPFISGKDSLNNEFSYSDAGGQRQTISIPPSLLISALGQVDDVAKCVTMDLKRAGNAIYLVGETKDELGGSHYSFVNNLTGGQVPTVDVRQAKANFAAMHQAIQSGSVRACHDCSEGGIATAIAEMCFAGELGTQLRIDDLTESGLSAEVALFSESNSRFLVEVAGDRIESFESHFADVKLTRLGDVVDSPQLTITDRGRPILESKWAELKQTWQKPLNFG